MPTLSVLQDPTEPNLVFLGTEHGLWVSIDKGANWTRWTHGYPSVSTMDLAIQEREADLAIATFGRSMYILDDIRPLRKLAANGGKTLDAPLAVFKPADAIIEGLREISRLARSAVVKHEAIPVRFEARPHLGPVQDILAVRRVAGIVVVREIPRRYGSGISSSDGNDIEIVVRRYGDHRFRIHRIA